MLLQDRINSFNKFETNPSQYTLRDKPNPKGLRLSKMGNPTSLLGLGLFLDETSVMSEKLQHLCDFGNIYEDKILNLIGNVSRRQETVVFEGIKGHIDAIYNEMAVVEVKTTGEGYYKRFTKYPVDDKGYLTQLSVYSHCVGLPGLFVVMNRNSFDISLVLLESAVKAHKLDETREKLDLLSNLNTVEDVYNLPIEHLQPEYYQKRLTGKNLLPASFRYSPFSHLFYNTYTELNNYSKPTTYVTGRTSKEEFMNRLEVLLG